MVYIRDAAATGGVLAFDSIFTTSAFLNANAPYQLRGANFEFPRVLAGRTLNTYIGLYMEAPQAGGGTTTNAFAMVTEPGAGNVGINTTSPLDPLHVVGVVRATGGVRFGDGSLQTTAGGGDITAVNTAAGTGLQGGATTGDANLSLLTSCAANQILKWTGTAWACAADAGTVTSITAGAGLTGGTITGSGTITMAPPQRTRAITYLAGCDNCSTLVTADSQRNFFPNVIGSMTVTSVACFSDAGSPVVNLQRNGGPANILNQDLTCSTTGNSTTSFTAEANLILNDRLDFVLVSNTGSAKRITLSIQTTVN
jgi:hypothetical protein